MYQVLARKYRPRNFIELVGQNHVSRALTSALERGRLHHAYLFTGTRGVGKTTIARILAKCLNCETGVTSTPCEVCATCTAVNEGRFIDLIEIDAASRTKVEDTRELLDNVPYAPTQGRYKVYLIDEVHMLSTHSFNALLKTLEEPPEHVKFLFATTDPQKLPITVISRCLQFTLRPLAVDEITSHLTNILQKEDISTEQDAIWQIAESAQGSLRDALSLTDQAIAYGQGSIQHQDVKEMLGLIDRTIIFDLILAIHQNQQQRVSALLMQFRQQALDVSLVLDQFISTLHELALLQYLPDLSLKYSAEINAKIMQLSAIISAQDLQLYYQVACKGRADLQLAVTQEQGFEMCVLRLLAFRPIQPNEIPVQPVQNTQAVASKASTVKLEQKNDSEQIDDASHQNNHELQTDTYQGNDHLQNSIPNNSIQNATTPINTEQNSLESTVNFENVKTSNENHDFDLDDDSDLDAVINSKNQLHEPSSDDYLDDEVEPQVEIIASAIVEKDSISKVADIDVNPAQDINQLDSGKDLNTSIEPSLTSFGDEPLSTTAAQNSNFDLHQDTFFLNPEEVVHENQVQTSIPNEVVEVESQTKLTEKDRVSNPSDSLMPQDILSLIPQVLEGEWNIDKWEYWFRNSDLSPAVQELAQQGVMTGQINGECTFLIPEKYETILAQFQHTLENELKLKWSQTKFHVHYQDVSEQTPFAKQADRKVRAYHRATELLSEEEAVKSLMAMFEGEIQNVQLK